MNYLAELPGIPRKEKNLNTNADKPGEKRMFMDSK